MFNLSICKASVPADGGRETISAAADALEAAEAGGASDGSGQDRRGRGGRGRLCPVKVKLVYNH